MWESALPTLTGDENRVQRMQCERGPKCVELVSASPSQQPEESIRLGHAKRIEQAIGQHKICSN